MGSPYNAECKHFPRNAHPDLLWLYMTRVQIPTGIQKATSLHVDMSTPYSETKGLVVNNEAPAVITTPGLPMAVSRIVGTVYGHEIKNKAGNICELELREWIYGCKVCGSKYFQALPKRRSSKLQRKLKRCSTVPLK